MRFRAEMGLYGYFLLIAHNWMKERGIGAWIIPREFMDVKYGKVLKDYLTNRVELIRIHCFGLNDKQFSNAEVSSCVLFFRKKRPSEHHPILFTFGRIDAPTKKVPVLIESLKKIGKWSQIEKEAFGLSDATEESTLRIGDLFKVKRGIATGANKFFILTEEEAKDLGLPPRFLVPILPSPKKLAKSGIIKSDCHGLPLIEPRTFLLNCSMEMGRLRVDFPELFSYISSGERIEINKRYLTGKRKPWYMQETRIPAPILCGCMATNRGGHKIIRFYRNYSIAVATNAYYLLYPRREIVEQLDDLSRFCDDAYDCLTKVDPDRILASGRSYGGGLYKIEPKELENLTFDCANKLRFTTTTNQSSQSTKQRST